MTSTVLKIALPPSELFILRDCVLTTITCLSLLHRRLHYYVRSVRLTYDSSKRLEVLELSFESESDRDEFLRELCNILPEIKQRKPTPADIKRVFYDDVRYNVICDEKSKTYRLHFSTGSLAGIYIPKNRRLTVYGPLAELFVDTVRFWVLRSHTALPMLVPRPSLREIRLLYDVSIGDLYARVAVMAPMSPSVYAHSPEGYMLFTVSSVCGYAPAVRVVLEEFLEVREEKGLARIRIRGSDRSEDRGFLNPTVLRLVREHPDIGYYLVALQTLRALRRCGLETGTVSGLRIQLYFVRARDQPWVHAVAVENFSELERALEASADKLGVGVNELCENLVRFVRNCARILDTQRREQGQLDESLISHLRLLLDSMFRGDPDVDIMYQIERYWSCPVL